MMKRWAASLLLGLFIFTASAFASPPVLDAYLKVQESLAQDSLQGAREGAAAMARATQDKSLSKSALAVSQAKTLDIARERFKTLSQAMSQWAQNEKPEGVDRVSCSMAGATWLQKHGPIRNPYYGKQMQSCGEIQK